MDDLGSHDMPIKAYVQPQLHRIISSDFNNAPMQ